MQNPTTPQLCPAGRCLVLSPKGKLGHQVQCLGVAEALGFETIVRDVALPWPARLFAPRGRRCARAGDSRWANADLVLASGRQAIPPARAIARRAGPRPFVGVLGDPGVPVRDFDFVWTPLHDRVAPADNTLATLTGPHRLTRARLADAAVALRPRIAHLPRLWIAVLVGGPSGPFRFGAAEAEELGSALAGLAHAHAASLLVTLSRRSTPDIRRVLRDKLADVPAWFWDGTGESPIFGLYGLADAFVITCDSVNMLGEAAFTGRPIYGWRLPGGAPKRDRFYEGLEAHGALRWFDGHLDPWSYPPLDSTPVIAAAIARRMGFVRTAA